MSTIVARVAPWRSLTARLNNWRRDAYVPLRVALSAEEQQTYGCTAATMVAGFVRKDRIECLRAFDELFRVTDEQVLMAPAFASVDERSHAFAQVAAVLKREGVFPHWQREMYAAKTSFGADTLFHYNRGVGAYFGLSQFATHLNGFVRDARTPHGRVSHVWIAQRSLTKSKWPGLLDTIVGGGLPAHISAHDNMVKETEEEAGLDTEWVSPRLRAAGSIGYVADEPNGLANNTMFIYDLEMPPQSVTLANRDGEVEGFTLWAVADVVNALWHEPQRFKPDICLVLLDFCVRHGVFTPDSMCDYQELQLALRSAANPYIEAQRGLRCE